MRGVISMAIAIYRAGYRSVIVPYENRLEAAAIGGMSVFPVKTITGTLDVLRGRVEPFAGTQRGRAAPRPS